MRYSMKKIELTMKVLVIEAFDGRLLASINDQLYAMDQVSLHETSSAEFDAPFYNL